MRQLIRALVCISLLTASMLVALGMASANPPGTIDVGHSGSSTASLGIGSIGVSSYGVAYQAISKSGRYGDWYGLATGTSTPAALSDLPLSSNEGLATVAGNIVAESNGAGKVEWETINGASGNASSSLVPSGSAYKAYEVGSFAAAPTGWLTSGYSASSPSTTDLLLVSTSRSVVDLGPFSGDFVLGGPDGALGVTYGETTTASYYNYNDPGTVTDLDLPSGTFGCTVVLTLDAVCNGDTDAYLVPLSGAAATVLALPEDQSPSSPVDGTDNDAIWGDTNGSVSFEPWTGGSITTEPTSPAVTTYASDDSQLALGLGASDASVPAQIATVTPPSRTATILATVSTPVAVEASQLAIGPGRVVFSDDAPASGLGAGAGPLWARSLSNTSGTLKAGATNLVYTDASDYNYPGFNVQVSGVRTLFDDTSNDLRLLQSGSTSSPVTIEDSNDGYIPPGQISGSRVLFESPTTGLFSLYDAVSGTSSSLTEIPAYSVAAIWGDSVVWMNTDGSIDLLNLASPTPSTSTVLPAQNGGTGSCYPGDADVDVPALFISGDYVAWSERCPDSSSPSQIGYVNATTGEPLVDLSSSEIPAALSGNYLAVITQSETPPITAIDLSTSAMTQVGKLSGPVEIDGSTIAWVDQEGDAEVAPLPTEPNPPRYLGDASTPATYTLTSGDWNAEFDSSATLTDCSVAITSGPSPIDTLPCNAADMKVGDAVVSWKGIDSGGSAMTPGTYTWTLTASNGDGSLLSPSGVALTLSGSISVAAPVPRVTSIDPTSGPKTGDTSVTIKGTGLSGATKVFFGSMDGTIVTDSSTSITVTSPAHSAGTAPVRVVTAGGESAKMSGDVYTYTS